MDETISNTQKLKDRMYLPVYDAMIKGYKSILEDLKNYNGVLEKK